MSTTNNHFDITLSNGWQDKTAYYFEGPDDSGVLHTMTLVVDTEPGNVQLSEFAHIRIDQMMLTLQRAEILKEEERTLANGNPVYECIVKWIPADGKIVFQKYVYMLLDGVGYTFSANFSKKTIKTIGTVVEEMIASFRPAGDPGAR